MSVSRRPHDLQDALDGFRSDWNKFRRRYDRRALDIGQSHIIDAYQRKTLSGVPFDADVANADALAAAKSAVMEGAPPVIEAARVDAEVAE